MKDVNNKASNIIIWLALGQHFYGKLFFKNLASAISYLSSDSLRYSNLYEHFRTKLQESIQCNRRWQHILKYTVTGDSAT